MIDDRIRRQDSIDRAEQALLQGWVEGSDFVRTAQEAGLSAGAASGMADFAERARANQLRLSANLKTHYDYIVCGSGSSGSVVARRLAENPEMSVLLLEAGGNDDVPSVMDPGQWIFNIGSERDWAFQAEPNPHLNGRALLLSMGKVQGGGSSINAMAWVRGHQNDWNHFADEAGETAWNYQSVLKIYKRIEDWQGEPDPARRGSGGIVYVQPAPDPNPIAPAMLEGAKSAGIPVFADANGVMMEGDGGVALVNLRIKEGHRQSVFRSYIFPFLDRPNLTMLTDATVTRLQLDGKRVTGVEIVHGGRVHTVRAGHEVVLSLGAINTPKVLMQSGIGDEAELKRHGIPLVQHLPGVGRNFQDHFMIAGCIWEYLEPIAPRNNAGEANLFWKSDSRLETPDVQLVQAEMPFATAENEGRSKPPPACWSIMPAIVRPKSTGEIRLTGPDPSDPVRIYANTLSEPEELTAVLRGLELCREIGNSDAMKPFAKREVMPAGLKGKALENFVRDGADSYSHETCSAKMGRDGMSVVDGRLKVYGVEGLRVADGSIMPRITTGNTMAPCVIIGERMGEILRA